MREKKDGKGPEIQGSTRGRDGRGRGGERASMGGAGERGEEMGDGPIGTV